MRRPRSGTLSQRASIGDSSEKEKAIRGGEVAYGELRIEEDEYAAEARLPKDPMFWIRIETVSPGRLKITDLNRGDQSVAFAGHALSRLIVLHLPIFEISVSNFMPNFREFATPTFELERRTSDVRMILNVAFSRLCIEACRYTLRQQDDIFDLNVQFQN